jgi:hypothetical protein
MVQNCVKLCESKTQRTAIARRAREVVATTYTVRRFRSIVQAAVRRQLH